MMLRGLLLKDFFALRKTLKMFFIILAMFCAVSVITGDSNISGGMILMLMIMLPLNSMSYDEYYKWDKYALTMPISRAQLVQSKYVMTALLAVGCFALLLVLGLFSSRAGDLFDSLVSTVVLTVIGLLYGALILPLAYRYGVEKARWLFVASVVGFVVLVGLLGFFATAFISVDLLTGGLTAALVCALPIAVLIFYLSYRISVNIVEKKEF